MEPAFILLHSSDNEKETKFRAVDTDENTSAMTMNVMWIFH